MLPSSKYRPLCGTAGRSIDLASGVLVLSGSFDDADGCAGRGSSWITLDSSWGESESRESKETMVNAPQNVGVKEVERFRSNT